MIPPYPIYPDGVTYVPSLSAPNQILMVTKAAGQISPLSPRDLYLMQRLLIPIGQTWAIFGNSPASAHFVQMGMLPPAAPMYSAVLMGPQSVPMQRQHAPTPPEYPGAFDAAAYEADVSDAGDAKSVTDGNR